MHEYDGPEAGGQTLLEAPPADPPPARGRRDGGEPDGAAPDGPVRFRTPARREPPPAELLGPRAAYAARRPCTTWARHGVGRASREPRAEGLCYVSPMESVSMP